METLSTRNRFHSIDFRVYYSTNSTECDFPSRAACETKTFQHCEELRASLNFFIPVSKDVNKLNKQTWKKFRVHALGTSLHVHCEVTFVISIGS